MNTEDAMLAKEIKGKRKKDKETSSNRDKKKETQSVGQTTRKKKKELSNRRPKFTNLTSLIMPIEQVLMQIKDNPSLHWPKPISTPTERRDKNKYCRFHQDHRHRSNECRHLKDQMETLVGKGSYRSMLGKWSPIDPNGRMIKTKIERQEIANLLLER